MATIWRMERRAYSPIRVDRPTPSSASSRASWLLSASSLAYVQDSVACSMAVASGLCAARSVRYRYTGRSRSTSRCAPLRPCTRCSR